jgi:hypothetical protein
VLLVALEIQRNPAALDEMLFQRPALLKRIDRDPD